MIFAYLEAAKHPIYIPVNYRVYLKTVKNTYVLTLKFDHYG